MDHEVYKGPLLFPVSGKLLIKKSWQQKYCYLYKASKFGIERLEVYDQPDSTKGAPPRIITLENCIKISTEGETYFTILTKNNPLPFEFHALNVDEKHKWLSAFQSVAFPDDLSFMTSIEEDNDLYCSSGQGIFNVRIHPSAVSERCGLDPNSVYTLYLTNTALQLKNTIDGSLLFMWPYHFIRRYGCKSGRFTFEAGRNCESGEGVFYLEHPNQQEIFRYLSSKMKSMKKLLKDDSSRILDCGNNQFHAALSMEARSRSPLPPSPTTTTTLHNIESTTSTESIDSAIKKLTVTPVKPPRKLLPTIATYEIVDKYDQIEYRNYAWRTLGVDNVKHTDNTMPPFHEEDEVYISWGDSKKEPVTPMPITKAPKVITETSTHDNYDQLNFFGSSTKLNVKSGYKQVPMGGGNHPKISPPSYNEYDEVQPPPMEEIRLADDSHNGYGCVRKLSRDHVDHHFHNNEPYAVISKPKRV